MKIPLIKAGILTCLTISLFSGNASAESDLAAKCAAYGTIQPNVNPSFQQINCLLTNAALKADIPPEVVKAVATQENGSWKQFNSKGDPIISYDGGIGLMQLTNQNGYVEEKLKNDIVYNIEAGVAVLDYMYTRVDLPKIKGAGRHLIENWYFSVMAYNGTKPVNSPLKQQTGERNMDAYQEQVFAKLEKESYLDGTKLAQYPFSKLDFDYNRESSENIKFNRLQYTLASNGHETAYLFKSGNRVETTAKGVNLRKKPGGTYLKTLPKNTALIITGGFTYDNSTANQFVWYPVQTVDKRVSGYVSSAYIKKLVDSKKPVISGVVSKSIPINSKFSPKTGVKAMDNADGDITSAIKVMGTVNTKKKGTYYVTYTVADWSKNTAVVKRKITVYDHVKPVISGAANKTIRLNSSFNPRAGVTARDNVDGSLTSKIKISGFVNTKKKGTYTLKYTVTDSSKNAVTVTRKITIDRTKPVISGAKSKTIRYKSSFNPKTGVTAKDNVDGNLTKKIKVTGKVNTKKKGTYTLTYTVTDQSKNQAAVKRKIIVK
ncbi:immunoglobulin-like domain-containing protein [Neobacillus kokaensis]|uniref:Lytic transglycosylase n=1 Tax=Neobacillus kokaensis TaxID=2759023 RepID=A0ABQ3NB14_9BACI|nr:immunoglobulin-like domain-containing protein [Neobacillus kokaensis]GHI01102.1 hypothetical protein AM1BK_46440 [Neobacillus kokaensis]